jgi:hypothetical protein
LPLHFDNQSIFKERFHLDKADPTFLHDEITVIDHALTRPWSVDKMFKRDPNPRPNWIEYNCPEGNDQIVVGKRTISWPGKLAVRCDASPTGGVRPRCCLPPRTDGSQLSPALHGASSGR